MTMYHHEEHDLLAFVRSDLLEGTGADVDATTPLFEDGWINSINILPLIGYVEARLGRRLDDEEIVMTRFRSVRAIADAFFDTNGHPS